MWLGNLDDSKVFSIVYKIQSLRTLHRVCLYSSFVFDILVKQPHFMKRNHVLSSKDTCIQLRYYLFAGKISNLPTQLRFTGQNEKH